MIEDYLLYLKNKKGRAPSSIHSESTGLKFFYKYVLNKQITIGFRITNKCTDPGPGMENHPCSKEHETSINTNDYVFSGPESR